MIIHAKNRCKICYNDFKKEKKVKTRAEMGKNNKDLFDKNEGAMANHHKFFISFLKSSTL